MRQEVRQNDALAKAALDDATGSSMAAPFVGLVVTEGDALVCAMIFNNFDRINIDLSITVLKPLNISAARAIAAWCFEVNGVRRVTCLTSPTNYPAIKSLTRFGFEYEGRMRARFPDGDALIFGLLASRQKLLRTIDGQHPLTAGPLRDSGGTNRFK